MWRYSIKQYLYVFLFKDEHFLNNAIIYSPQSVYKKQLSDEMQAAKIFTTIPHHILIKIIWIELSCDHYNSCFCDTITVKLSLISNTMQLLSCGCPLNHIQNCTG
jgi:hypothetical protein